MAFSTALPRILATDRKKSPSPVGHEVTLVDGMHTKDAVGADAEHNQEHCHTEHRNQNPNQLRTLHTSFSPSVSLHVSESRAHSSQIPIKDHVGVLAGGKLTG